VVYYALEFETCSEDTLIRSNHSGESCGTPKEIEEAIKNSTVKIIFLTDSFKEDVYKDYPVERTPKVHYFNYMQGQSSVQEITINKLTYQLHDSWITEMMNVKNFDLYNVQLGQKLDGDI